MLKIFCFFESGTCLELILCNEYIYDYIKFIDYAILDPDVSFRHYKYISKFINKNNYHCFHHLLSDNINICSELIIHLPLNVAILCKHYDIYSLKWFDCNIEWISNNIRYDMYMEICNDYNFQKNYNIFYNN